MGKRISEHDTEKLPGQVYRLHCQGHAVSIIARKLKLPEDEVRGYIVNQWRIDKEAASMASRIQFVRGIR